MTEENLNKIAVALIEKYGTENGSGLLVQLIQEMNKPAQMQIVREPIPYTLRNPSDSNEWYKDISVNSLP